MRAENKNPLSSLVTFSESTCTSTVVLLTPSLWLKKPALGIEAEIPHKRSAEDIAA